MEFDRIADIKRMNFIIASLRERLPHGGEVLDVGCGNGIITRAVGAAGFMVLGIDTSTESIARARSDNHSPNVHFRVEAAEDLAATGPVYDGIICSEVLEHLSRPQELLHTIHQLLKPQGLLVVTVPNGRGPRELLVTRPVQYIDGSKGFAARWLRLLKRSMGYAGKTIQSSADDLTHLQFFTATTLQKLAAENGFFIQTLRPTNFIEQVFPFSLLARRSQGLQRLDCRIAEKLPTTWTSSFMSIWSKHQPAL